MKKYEVTYIIHPDLEGSTGKITEKIKNQIAGIGGKIISEESWGKKKLAYKVKKNSFGIYEYLLLEAEPMKIKELERTLKLSEEVIRSMVVAIFEEPIQKKPKQKEKPEKKRVEEPKPKAADKKEEPKTKSEKQKEEKERLKELDEELKKIIGE